MSVSKAAIKITNEIIKMLNEGVCPWTKGWTCHASGKNPFNLNSGREYTGMINTMMCSIKANGRIPAFATASRSAGRFPVKGCKAVAILRPNVFDKVNPETGKKESTFCGWKYINVFHYTDLKGVDHKAIEKEYPSLGAEGSDFSPIARAEEIIKSMPNLPTIKHGGDRAFYAPALDMVGMPSKSSFHNEGCYYQTLFHELGHSTLHVTRLDRKQGREGLETSDHRYSFEELVAELTACFVGSEARTINEARMQNSAAYLKSWVGHLQSNPEWILKASAEATKASKYILNQMDAPKG